ncbi:Putative tartrate transporter [Paraburkholderia domus]|uniref:MFS transporter n=1 Tax=Paraburkholderia domus TaxID=2793075 RepID=UPI001B05A827|nr:MFS transporter [Paraburkholderia domus]CAE6865725.1 Putative tartrate transporter [Paraburkholderia domus]
MSSPSLSADTDASSDAWLEAAALRKITWRIMPFLFLVYVLSYLDRVNIGYAKLQFTGDLGLSNAAYGLGAGIFFFGYFVFEVPSNLLLKKFGARATIARITMLWGLLSCLMMFVHSETMFYVLRFFLGVAEAGLVPGVVLYLTFWFPSDRRARMVAVFMAAIPVAGIIGAPLSGFLMSALHEAHGLRGWQWMFLIEGIPSILAGFWALAVLRNTPAEAAWLTDDEKRVILSRLSRENTAAAAAGAEQSLAVALRSGRFWLLTLIYFCLVAGNAGFSFWLPQIVKDLGVTNLVTNGFVTAIPYLAAGIGMILIGRSSDITGERRWHYAVCCFIGAAGLLGSASVTNSIPLAVTGLSIAYIGILAGFGIFWSMSTTFLQGTAAVAGIAVINSIANLAGYVSPYVLGIVKDATHSVTFGLVLIAGALIVGGLVTLMMPRVKVQHAAAATPSRA